MMRITLAQWRDKYGLPMTDFGTPGFCGGSGCHLRRMRSSTDPEMTVILCSYHEGFVDGFDAARGGG